MTFTQGQFYRKCSKYSSLTWVWKCNNKFRINCISQGPMSWLGWIISSSKYNVHSELLSKVLDILKIEHLFSQSCLKFVYKFKKCQLPKYFLSLQCVPRSSIHDHDTRNASNIDTIYTRTKLASKCIWSQLPLLLISNDTSDIILSKITTHSIHGFSFFIKRYYLAQYSTQCNDRECFVCSNYFQDLSISNTPYLYYVIAAKHIVTVNIPISIHNSHQHISSHCHHNQVSYPTQDLVILKWILMPPGETHDSGYCLNGLPSTQPPLFLLNRFDFDYIFQSFIVTYYMIAYFLVFVWCLLIPFRMFNLV